MKKVIISYDIHASLRAEQSFLGRSDIEVVTSESNPSALALHKAEKADLIIAKLDDPELSGEQLCSSIRRDDALRNVSIIIVCSAGEADLKRCVDCSANAFVTVPLNPAVLLQEAYQLLNIAPRRSCRIKVKVKLEGTAKGRPFAAEAENISTAGMLLRSAAELMEGDPLVVTFSFPGTGKFTATAEVVRMLPKQKGRPSAYGISFVELGTEALSAIEALSADPETEGCRSV